MHTWGNQLVPELLLKLSDTVHIQYRYNEHVHEVSCQKKFFLQSDCLSNLAILYGLCILDSSFPYWPLCVSGVSNKHCLFQFSLTETLNHETNKHNKPHGLQMLNDNWSHNLHLNFDFLLDICNTLHVTYCLHTSMNITKMKKFISIMNIIQFSMFIEGFALKCN